MTKFKSVHLKIRVPAGKYCRLSAKRTYPCEYLLQRGPYFTDGKAPQDLWEHSCKLNLGKLRVMKAGTLKAQRCQRLKEDEWQTTKQLR